MANWPMDDTAVVNASPFIFLSRADRLDLLHDICGKILIPQAVADEILLNGPEDISAQALINDTRFEVKPSLPIPHIIARWGLGHGESSVLALADLTPGLLVVIDDLAGRRCALTLGMKVRGTLGIVLIAKKRGIIPSARSVMEELIQSGLYLSAGVLNEALRRVGE